MVPDIEKMITDYVASIYDKLGEVYYMDYVGQQFAQQLSHCLCAVFATIGTIVGYYTQRMQDGVYIALVGVILSLIICIPPWPCLYQKNPIKWQKAKPTASSKDGKDD